MENFIVPIVAAFSLAIGYLLGRYIIAIKYKSVSLELQKQIVQITADKDRLTTTLKNFTAEKVELKAEYENRIEKIENEREVVRKEKDLLSTELARKNAEYEGLQSKLTEQKAEVEALQEKFTTQFENLANKILEQKSEKFTSLNKENLETILTPLSEKIKSFEEKVNKNNTDFLERHSQLGEHLKTLNEQSVKISEEANNLTRALKGENKTQGNWGELILEKVLQKSGLVKDREYFVQKAVTDDEGNKVVPDVIIHLPNERKMIIDSKVSLIAYERYVNEEDENSRSKHLKDHCKSLQNHILQLSSKKYEDLYKTDSPDFVLMFIPIEPALYLAQNTDNSFFYSAFQKNILLVSPTTLLSTLRTIDAIWSNEKQQRNAIEIANHATSLYHKFKILLDDLENLGNRIKSSSNAYEAAMKKLTGQQNLIKDIDKLEELGIAPKQKISPLWLVKAGGDSTEKPSLNLNLEDETTH